MMVINTTAEIYDWCCANGGALVADLDEQAAEHALRCMVSVVWRHGRGQGLQLGDDWGIVFEMYTAEELRKIVAAAAESAAADRRRRRRRGY